MKTDASHRTDRLAVEGDNGQAVNLTEATRGKEEEWDLTMTVSVLGSRYAFTS